MAAVDRDKYTAARWQITQSAPQMLALKYWPTMETLTFGIKISNNVEFYKTQAQVILM